MEQKTETEEIWMPVKGFYGRYEVSNKGNIMSLVKRSINHGVTHEKKRKKMIKQSLVANGYYTCTLTNESGQYREFFHRVVATAFIPNPENHPCVNHINGIKTDNRVENLEWVSHRQNNWHKVINTSKELPPCITLTKYNTYNVRPRINRKKHTVGTFKTLNEAIIALQSFLNKHEIAPYIQITTIENIP